MIIDKVRYTVEKITGLKVSKVTVSVESIRLQENSGS
jgi:uncharacterized alkaline shock family protein YloU